MNNLMSDKNVTANSLLGHKSRLVRGHNLRQKWLQSARENLGDDFIVRSAQRNRAEIRHLPGAGDLQNETNVGLILSAIEVSSLKKLPDIPANVLTNDVPVRVVKPRRETVRSWSFISVNSKYCSTHFLFIWYGREMTIIFIRNTRS